MCQLHFGFQRRESLIIVVLCVDVVGRNISWTWLCPSDLVTREWGVKKGEGTEEGMRRVGKRQKVDDVMKKKWMRSYPRDKSPRNVMRSSSLL